MNFIADLDNDKLLGFVLCGRGGVFFLCLLWRFSFSGFVTRLGPISIGSP